MSVSSISSPILAKPVQPFAWPTQMLSKAIPRRYRRKLRSKMHSRQSPASNVTAIEWRFNPMVNIQKMRKHKWSLYDLQYLILVLLLAFAAAITPQPHPVVKALFACLLALGALMPITSQFLLPSLSIWTWLIFFFSCRCVYLFCPPPHELYLTCLLQLHPRLCPPTYLGQSPASAGKHPLRRQPVQHPFQEPARLP